MYNMLGSQALKQLSGEESKRKINQSDNRANAFEH